MKVRKTLVRVGALIIAAALVVMSVIGYIAHLF